MGHALRTHALPHEPVQAPPRDGRRPVRTGARAALFAEVLASSRHRPLGLGVSLVAHAALVFLLILLPIISQEDLPEHRDYIRALLYAPPPPPPLPPPKGSPLVREAPPAKKAAPTEARPSLTVPADVVKAQPAAIEAKPAELEPWGEPAGSDAGVPEGMEGGVEGGMVGGVPGGVIGGVIGGTGDVPAPVMDYDQPPRLIRQVKPVYPQDAFIKKVEGTVLVEIVIGTDGRISRARVLRSIPLLDAAALASVKEWVFAPGLRKGRPVATVAQAPITFRIY